MGDNVDETGARSVLWTELPLLLARLDFSLVLLALPLPASLRDLPAPLPEPRPAPVCSPVVASPILSLMVRLVTA